MDIIQHEMRHNGNAGENVNERKRKSTRHGHEMKMLHTVTGHTREKVDERKNATGMKLVTPSSHPLHS
jgi:hypothetical protein